MRETVIRVPKATMIVLLAILYGLAFVVTPYWMVAQSTPARMLILFLIVAAGAGWLALVGNEIRIGLNLKRWGYFGVVFSVLLAVHYKYLTSAIAWRGDEHFHIENTLALVAHVSATGLLAALVLAGSVLLLSRYKPRWAAFAGLTVLIFWIVFVLVRKPFDEFLPNTLLRYPFLNYWLFSFIPKVYTVGSTPYQEYLYRIVPFLAVVGVVYLVWNALAVKQIYSKVLWLAVFGTIPILSYYASILYLEPLAVFFMVIVCLRAKFLLGADAGQIKHDIGWYALVTVGFIKETAFIFLVCFIFVRFITRWLPKNWIDRTSEKIEQPANRWIKTFIDCFKKDVSVIISAFLPILIYLDLRFLFLQTRNFAPDLAVLADSQIYPVIARSLWEQFGGTIFLFLLGMILLVQKKDYSSALFFLLLVIVYPFFHALDSKSYAGYSRFNLFLLPPILAGSVVFLKQALFQSKLFGALLGIVLLGMNIFYSPLLPDGTKKSHWGIYFSSISEEYYPYQETFTWLEQEYRNARILFAGFNYPYPFEFYFEKHSWNPPYRTIMNNDAVSETETLKSAVEKAELREMNLIVFHVLENKAVLPLQIADFQQVKTFSNRNNTIVIYNKPRQTP